LKIWKFLKKKKGGFDISSTFFHFFSFFFNFFKKIIKIFQLFKNWWKNGRKVAKSRTFHFLQKCYKEGSFKAAKSGRPTIHPPLDFRDFSKFECLKPPLLKKRAVLSRRLPKLRNLRFSLFFNFFTFFLKKWNFQDFQKCKICMSRLQMWNLNFFYFFLKFFMIFHDFLWF